MDKCHGQDNVSLLPRQQIALVAFFQGTHPLQKYLQLIIKLKGGQR